MFNNTAGYRKIKYKGYYKMNKTIKRSCIIVIVLLFALLSFLGLMQKTNFAHAEKAQENEYNDAVQAYAENENYDTYLSFTLTTDGKGYKVRAKDKTLTEIEVPSVYNGVAVTEIFDNGFMSCRNLKTIFIPSSVKKIGTNAFYNCTSLERVYGATDVETIGNSAFSGCANLKYFCIYDSITTLGSTVFRNISNDVYIRMKEDKFAAIAGINANWSTGRASSSQIIYGTEQICEAIDEVNRDEGFKLIQAQESNSSISLLDSEGAESTPYYYCSKVEDGILKPVREIDSCAFMNWENENLIILYDENVEETDYKVHLAKEAFASM